MTRDAVAKFVVAIILLVPRIALSQNLAPLSIAREGYVYAGGKYSTVNGRQVMSGQLYAEYQIPTLLLHPYPVVMVPGAGSSGAMAASAFAHAVARSGKARRQHFRHRNGGAATSHI